MNLMLTDNEKLVAVKNRKNIIVAKMETKCIENIYEIKKKLTLRFP